MKEIEELYANSRAKLLRKLWRLRQKQEDNEDTLQNAVIRAFKNLHKFDPERASLATWFNQVLMSQYWDEIRKEKKKPPMEEVNENSAEDPASGQTEALLRQLLSEVPNTFHRDVLTARLVQGYSYKEVEKMFGISREGLKKILKRFKERV